ncbi:MAG: phytoene/squalene synthase family protein [Anaerolineae bacterium]
MISQKIFSTFRRGSRTYFYSSVFFPPDVRDDVFKLYAFVRLADDFIDQAEQDIDGFEAFVGRYREAMGGQPTGDDVVDGFAEVARRRSFDPGWAESFFAAMRRDTTDSDYEALDDVESYMHGSAEVIGLFMARILDLPEESYKSAQLLGRAMQYVNFLRDVDEDQGLGRTYIPRSVRAAYGFEELTPEAASSGTVRFAAMMRGEIDRYRRWQMEAERGYAYIRPRYRIPVQTAADMYKWTADVIERDPLVVFDRKVKPSVARVVARLVRNAASTAAGLVLEASPLSGPRRSSSDANARLRGVQPG